MFTILIAEIPVRRDVRRRFLPILTILTILTILSFVRSSRLTGAETPGLYPDGTRSGVVQTRFGAEAEILASTTGFAEIDSSGADSPQITLPTSVAWTRIKGGWIDVEQLTSR